MTDTPDPLQQAARIEALEAEVSRLRKTNAVLLDRVEHRINVEGGAFAAFQAASNLEKMVARRTAELRNLNQQLEHELTLRRRFESALLRAKREAEEATASRTRFVAAASHDLRQPLNAAVLYLEAVDSGRLDAADADSLAGARQALGTLDRLLSALLDISRLDSGGLYPEPTHLPLQHLFRRLDDEYRTQAGARGLRLRVVPTGAVVHCDAMLLETMLRNLLSNALKYTARGSVLMGARQRGDRIHIEVRDSGAGIEPDHLERIFEEFWRAPGAAREERGSIGLGLAIVQRVSRLLGTPVGVRSAPGRGSTFSLELARGEPARVGEARGGGPPAETGDFAGCLVVVVDDNTEVLRSMARLLQQWDCRVIAGSGVEEVLTTIIDGDMRPDLLLADYHLHDGLTGLDAIRAINRELEQPAPAAMISSDNSASLRERLAGAGVPLLTKPVEPARLRALMRHLLAAAPA